MEEFQEREYNNTHYELSFIPFLEYHPNLSFSYAKTSLVLSLGALFEFFQLVEFGC